MTGRDLADNRGNERKRYGYRSGARVYQDESSRGAGDAAAEWRSIDGAGPGNYRRQRRCPDQHLGDEREDKTPAPRSVRLSAGIPGSVLRRERPGGGVGYD